MCYSKRVKYLFYRFRFITYFDVLYSNFEVINITDSVKSGSKKEFIWNTPKIGVMRQSGLLVVLARAVHVLALHKVVVAEVAVADAVLL